jgi:hypothetical protein
MPFRRGAALCAGLLMLAACAERNDGETVLARVDGDAVTESDFRRELGLRPFARQEYLETLPGRKEMLELLVRRRIVLSEAERTSFVRSGGASRTRASSSSWANISATCRSAT